MAMIDGRIKRSLTRTIMSQIPGELIDAVIDGVQNSPSTLTACSLVCRQWVPRSRYHSFGSIELVRSGNRDTVKSFLHILESPFVTIVPSVREVRISQELSYSTPLSIRDTSSYSAPALSIGDIIRLLGQHGIAPTFISISGYCHNLGRAGPFPSTTRMHWCLMSSFFEDTVDFIHDFTSLECLFLNKKMSFGQIMATGKPCRTLPTSLRELRVVKPQVLTSMLALHSPPIPPRLMVYLIERDGWEDVIVYLTDPRVSSTLRSFTLDNCFAAHLPRLPALRHLCIRKSFRFMASHASIVLASLHLACGAQQLETVELLDSTILTFGFADGGKWKELDSMLADRVAFPCLRAVILGGEDLAVDGRIRPACGQMSLCDAQGILSVQYRSAVHDPFLFVNRFTPSSFPEWISRVRGGQTLSGSAVPKPSAVSPGPRAECSSWVSKDQKKILFLFGAAGRNAAMQHGQVHGHLYSYGYGDMWGWDIGESWTRERMIGNVPSPRGEMACVYHEALDKVILFGGYSPTVPTWFDEMNDTMTSSSSSTNPSPSPVSWRQVLTRGFPAYRAQSWLVIDSKTGKIYLFSGYKNTTYVPSKGSNSENKDKDKHKPKPSSRSFVDLWQLKLDLPGVHFTGVDLEEEARTAVVGPWQRCFACGSTGPWRKCGGTCKGCPFFCDSELLREGWKEHKET
ncbi:hypothetical protein FB45DRAFT_1005464 [Roridomyces roridus]|uniref:Uncharacterized protein n=1 Tax=Roridomyces roridus TaxID=1738132 RepID=A0AAD7BLL9_9AGAR|nr:hypothetical protein FB45DRAFT_1005464 [Roridomyces roridus]